MNLSNAKAITVKGKSVSQIDINGRTVWRAKAFVPLSYIESDGASYIVAQRAIPNSQESLERKH